MKLLFSNYLGLTVTAFRGLSNELALQLQFPCFRVFGPKPARGHTLLPAFRGEGSSLIWTPQRRHRSGLLHGALSAPSLC